MKPTRYKQWAVMALALASGFLAGAQSNRVPSPQDYEQFSSFITQRNIFDPSRYAITPGTPRRFNRQTLRYAPTFTLVGTMSYEKGMFAFFDGNQPDLRKVLYQSESNSIVGFTVAGITSTNVTLQTADKKQTLQLKIGDAMRQEGTSWQPANGQGGFFAGTSSGESASPAASDSSSPDAGATAAPSPALEGNDVLKKLMQQREQELK